MRSQRLVMLVRSGVVVGVSLASVLGATGNVMAQALKDVQSSDTPLVLKAQGSFFVGGEKIDQTRGEVGDLAPGGHIAVNQMYVRYMILGLLAEKAFGRVRLFVNGENLTGVRQTRWDSLLRPTQAADGRWTVDAWAPLEGRTVNGGLRIRF